MRVEDIKVALLSTVSCVSILAYQGPALAQDIEDEFLGTIELGESKREIKTETAFAETDIDQAEIDDRQAGTVAELIDSVPGVSLVNGSTPTGSGINIRGYGASSSYGTDQKVLILVDGATTGSEELYRIGNQLFTDPQLYKEVSVIRGTAGSFEFGSGVVGGVVLLETKDASDFTGGEVGFRFRQTLEGSSNGNGFVTSSILAWQPTENWEFLLNYTYREQSDQTDGSGALITNSKFAMPSTLLKGKYSFGSNNDHAITVSYNNSITEERDVPYDTFGTTGGIFGNVDRNIETQIAGLKYTFNPTGNDLVDVSVNLTYTDQYIESSYIPGSSSGGSAFDSSVAPLGDADQQYETTKLTAKNRAYFQTGAVFHDLRAGVEFINRKRLDAYAAPGGTDQRLAFFVVDDMQISDRLTITPAVRYEIQDITGTDIIADGETDPYNGSYNNTSLMGGLSFRYEFNSGFAVFASAAYTESLPIIDDLNTPLYMNQPERARTFEGGVSYTKGDLFGPGDIFRAKVNVYNTNLWDVTSYSFAGDPLSNVNTQGIEIETSYGHASGVYVDFNANIVDGTETREDGSEGRWRSSPADSARLTIGKRFGEMVDVSWEVIAAKSVTDNLGAVTPGYAVNNLRVTYRPQNGVFQGAELRAGIENILDHSYLPYLSTRNAPGRNIKLTLAKTF